MVGSSKISLRIVYAGLLPLAIWLLVWQDEQQGIVRSTIGILYTNIVRCASRRMLGETGGMGQWRWNLKHGVELEVCLEFVSLGWSGEMEMVEDQLL